MFDLQGSEKAIQSYLKSTYCRQFFLSGYFGISCNLCFVFESARFDCLKLNVFVSVGLFSELTDVIR